MRENVEAKGIASAVGLRLEEGHSLRLMQLQLRVSKGVCYIQKMPRVCFTLRLADRVEHFHSHPKSTKRSLRWWERSDGQNQI